jgi:hypothetical protein
VRYYVPGYSPGINKVFVHRGAPLRFKKKKSQAGCRWLMPVVLATQKAEIRRTGRIRRFEASTGK